MTTSQVRPGSLKAPRFFFVAQICTLILCLLVTIFIQKDFSDYEKSKPLHMAVDPGLISHMVLGFHQMAADIYWVRTIQELDFKEPGKINKGWVFQMLDSVTNLSPRYKMVYLLGALVVSVVVHDDEGARLLLEKGVSVFPDDWAIAYHAGYHYLYVIKDCRRAAELFRSAVDHGAPACISALSARLYNIAGQYEIAKSVLTNALKNTETEPEYHEKIQKRLDDLEESHRLGRTNDFAKCEDFKDSLPDEKGNVKAKYKK